MKNYNKLLLRYFTPYFIVTALLGTTIGTAVYSVSNTKTGSVKKLSAPDYILGSFLLSILLYMFYFYAIKIPLDMRNKVLKIADKYLVYASAKNPDMVKVKELFKNKQFMTNISNIIFNSITKEDRTLILKIIQEYDVKSSQLKYDEKVLNEELENKIFEILKNRSLLDSGLDINILGNATTYMQNEGR